MNHYQKLRREHYKKYADSPKADERQLCAYFIRKMYRSELKQVMNKETDNQQSE
jgi:hypothetical protein